MGGPIVRDRLWFYGSYRTLDTQTAVEGVTANANVGLRETAGTGCRAQRILCNWCRTARWAIPSALTGQVEQEAASR